MKNEKKLVDEQLSLSMTENFYVEDLEDRLEMTAAVDPIIPNDLCATWVIPF